MTLFSWFGAKSGAAKPLLGGKASATDSAASKHGDGAAGEAAGASRRTITPWGLACLAFMCVCAGPYGIEDAVGAAGPLPVLLACAGLPFLWGLPQSLITAELSTMMDENGGYILWVRRGLGNFWGWMSSYNSFVSNLCDLPLYAILLSQYTRAYLLRTLAWDLGEYGEWGVKAACLIFITALNIRGVTSVSAVSILITILIVAPFAIEPAAAEAQIDPSQWVRTTPTIDWSLFVSTMLWNYQGWDGMGCVAGEVKDGGRTYPKGIIIALLMMTLVYAVPVAVGVSIVPDLSQWQSGLLETIASRISPWLGLWVVIGAMLSEVGEMNVVMCNTSRALWAMAKRKMVPPVLGRSSSRWGTPVAAIGFQFVTTALLMTFGFEVLVVLDTFLNNVSLLLESASFLALRHKQPNAHRPYKIPGGLVVAWLIMLPKFAIIFSSLALAGRTALLLCGGAQVVFILLYVIRNALLVPHDDPSNLLDNASVTSASTAGGLASPGGVVVVVTPPSAMIGSTHGHYAATASAASGAGGGSGLGSSAFSEGDRGADDDDDGPLHISMKDIREAATDGGITPAQAHIEARTAALAAASAAHGLGVGASASPYTFGSLAADA